MSRPILVLIFYSVILFSIGATIGMRLVQGMCR